MSIKVKKIVYSGLLVAIGIVLPQLFHIFGPMAGKIFLPMHISILLAGFLIGPIYGLAVSMIVPIASSIITGMPAVPMLYFMLVELAVYALATGFFYKKLKLNTYLSLILSMLCGRAAYGLSLAAAVNIFQLNFPFANTTAFFGGILSAWPGILLQLLIIPPIVYALEKGGLAIEKRYANQ